MRKKNEAQQFKKMIRHQKKQLADLQTNGEKGTVINSAKRQFLENIEHDLRVSCAGIISAVDILQQSATTLLQRELLKDISRASNLLLTILHSISDFDAIFYDSLPMVNNKFSIRDLVSDIVSAVKPLAQQKSLTFFTLIDNSVPELLIGDNYRITRILLNLVNNAIKFTRKGVIKITAKSIRRNKNHVMLQLTVSDTGIGIPKNKQAIIYERFTQLAPFFSNGSGLGLAIVKQFIRDLDGKITLTSVVNKGATFTCVLPLKLAKNIESIITVGRRTLEKTPELKILLVDDDLLSRKTSKILIESKITKLPVDAVVSGRTALKLIKKNNYDIVFMDLNLPDINGKELAKKIKALKKAHPMIITLSAHAMKGSNNMEIDGCLKKPIDIEHAISVIQKITAKKITKQSSKAIGKTTLSKTALQSLIKMLRGELPSVKQDLQQAFNKNDLVQLQQVVHKLKGGASYCHIPGIKRACLLLENAIENKESKKEIKILLQKILAEIDNIIQNKRILG